MRIYYYAVENPELSAYLSNRRDEVKVKSITRDWVDYWEQRREKFIFECEKELEIFNNSIKAAEQSQLKVLEDIISVSNE